MSSLQTDAVEAPRARDLLPRLYLARSAFALVWAVGLAVSLSTSDLLTGVLLVLYPLVDVAAALVDHRSASDARARGLLVLTMGLSLLAAVGLALAAATDASDVLRVWGAWAVAAGILQLVVAARRRHAGGQWPLVLSGAISTVAGAGFVAAAGADAPSLTGLAGYAALGGVFFLVSAVRLRRATA